MTRLTEFVDELHDLLDVFEDYWLRKHAQDPENFPLEMGDLEWLVKLFPPDQIAEFFDRE